MAAGIVEWALRNRVLVLVGTVLTVPSWASRPCAASRSTPCPT